LINYTVKEQQIMEMSHRDWLRFGRWCVSLIEDQLLNNILKAYLNEFDAYLRGYTHEPPELSYHITHAVWLKPVEHVVVRFFDSTCQTEGFQFIHPRIVCTRKVAHLLHGDQPSDVLFDGWLCEQLLRG
jgi:hypothetical protein